MSTMSLEIDTGDGMWCTLNLVSAIWSESEQELALLLERWRHYFGPDAKYRIVKPEELE